METVSAFICRLFANPSLPATPAHLFLPLYQFLELSNKAPHLLPRTPTLLPSPAATAFSLTPPWPLLLAGGAAAAGVSEGGGAGEVLRRTAWTPSPPTPSNMTWQQRGQPQGGAWAEGLDRRGWAKGTGGAGWLAEWAGVGQRVAGWESWLSEMPPQSMQAATPECPT